MPCTFRLLFLGTSCSTLPSLLSLGDLQSPQMPPPLWSFPYSPRQSPWPPHWHNTIIVTKHILHLQTRLPDTAIVLVNISWVTMCQICTKCFISVFNSNNPERKVNIIIPVFRLDDLLTAMQLVWRGAGLKIRSDSCLMILWKTDGTRAILKWSWSSHCRETALLAFVWTR